VSFNPCAVVPVYNHHTALARIVAALREGLFETLHVAGANIFPPSAGSNQAFNMGALAEDEVLISTQARNFPGRNGHPKSRHFLASALTVATSAITGRITDPRSLPP